MAGLAPVPSATSREVTVSAVGSEEKTNWPTYAASPPGQSGAPGVALGSDPLARRVRADEEVVSLLHAEFREARPVPLIARTRKK